MPFSTFPAGTLPGQRRIIGRAEAALHHRSFATSERGLAAVGPAEVLRPVIRGEAQDRVALNAQVLHLLHHRTDDVVKLRHARLRDGPAVLRGDDEAGR